MKFKTFGEWVAFAGQQENKRSSSCLMPRSAEQEPHAQQECKEDRIGQGGAAQNTASSSCMDYAAKTEMLRIDMALLVSLALNVLTGSRSE